jgi:hypothetical protein
MGPFRAAGCGGWRIGWQAEVLLELAEGLFELPTADAHEEVEA